MTINCVWEHNGRDTLLYAVDFVGAYTRGETLEAAVRKMQAEICSYLKWCGKKAVTSMDIVIIEEKVSELAICDADSDVLFESEKAPLTAEEYIKLKALALKSAQDFLALYDSVPDKNATAASERKTFYGQVPRTANEMYEHTKNVNTYYFAEIAVDADHDGNIYECRKRGFESLESNPDFLQNTVRKGSYGEDWSHSSAGRASALQAEGQRFEPVKFPPCGPVVQLVRTLACHARGRQFEPDPGRHYASVAQSVEQGTENPRVIGSIPTGGTSFR